MDDRDTEPARDQRLFRGVFSRAAFQPINAQRVVTGQKRATVAAVATLQTQLHFRWIGASEPSPRGRDPAGFSVPPGRKRLSSRPVEASFPPGILENPIGSRVRGLGFDMRVEAGDAEA